MQINSITSSITMFPSGNIEAAKGQTSQSVRPSSTPVNFENESDNAAELSSKIEWMNHRNKGVRIAAAPLKQIYSRGSAENKKYSPLIGFYSKELNNKNFDNFVTAAANSGDNYGIFMETAANLYYGDISGSEEELAGFLYFSAQLSKEDLSHFLTALQGNPHELDNIMAVSSKLSKNKLSAYLEAASLAGKEIEQFNNIVSEMMLGQDDPEQLRTWLTAAVQSGEQMMDFLITTANLSEESRNRVSAHIVNRFKEDSEKNFIQFIQSAKEDQINDLLDVSETLNEKDMDNLMDAAAGAQYQVEDFITNLKDISTNRPEQISNFLATASHSENEIKTFLKIFDSIDLEFTGKLSTVDTVNFLKAATDTTFIARQDRIDEITKGLRDDEDLSNFLYAASIQTSGMENFLSQMEGLKNQDKRNDFITEIVNQGNEVMERGVYMKGILSEDEYNDFQVTLEASQFDDTSLRALVEKTGELDGETRSRLLDAAASSGSETREFIEMFDLLSYEKRNAFLEISSRLGETEQEKFIHEALRTKDNISNFIDVSKRVQENAQTKFVFNDFLSALSNTEDADEHQALIDFVGKLGIGQQRSFLSVASSSNRNIPELIELGNKILFTSDAYSAFNLIKAFDDIAAGAEKERILINKVDSYIEYARRFDEDAHEIKLYPQNSFVEVYV